MNFEEFKIVCKKRKRYDRNAMICSIPLFITWITIMVCLVKEVQFNATVLLVVIAVCVIFGVITFTFGWKAEKCNDYEREYITYVIEKILQMNGAKPENYQIMYPRYDEYKVIFNHCYINYNIVRAQTSVMVKALSEVSGKRIRILIG